MAGFEHGYALLVGVGGDLAMTATDATDLASLLKDPARAAYPEAHVLLRTNANAKRADVFQAFADLRARVLVDANATVVVYYSGHGYKFVGDRAPEYFLCPSGFDRARKAETGISDVEFTEQLESLKAKRLIVFLDCCHAAGLPLAKGGDGRTAALPPAVLARLGMGQGQVVFASCTEGQSSYALQGARNSVFTTCLLEALGDQARSRAGFACVLDVVAHVMDEVPRRVPDQTPFLNSAKALSQNLAICAVPAAKRVTASPVVAAAIPPTKGSANRFTQGRIDALLPAHELASDLCGKLRVALVLESNPVVKAQLEHQLRNAEDQTKEFEQKLEELFAKLEGG